MDIIFYIRTKFILMTFKSGFKVGNILFGWHKKELWRLPSTSGVKTYGFKKLDSIVIGNKVGYRVNGKPKTIEQLSQMTMLLNSPVVYLAVDDSDCPYF